MKFYINNFQAYSSDWWLRYRLWNWPSSDDCRLADKPTLVHVMAWCRQATSHYLYQCWPSSMRPCIVTRPQWVKGKNRHDDLRWKLSSGATIVTIKSSRRRPLRFNVGKNNLHRFRQRGFWGIEWTNADQTKWLTFSRRHFEVNLMRNKCFVTIFTNVYF